MQLELIQSSCAAINSIYIIHNFLEDLDFLKTLENRIDNHTKEDEMAQQTNVKATMTTYKKLLNDEQFNKINIKILETLRFIYTLRTPTPDEKMSFNMFDCWGMRHKKNNYTVNHIHGSLFSGAFYIRVPSPTEMFFEDFFKSVVLKDNMLLLFPGFSKHAVGEHQGDIDRLSMAFNINILFKYDK